MSASFEGMTSGSLNGQNIQSFAAMGMAKAVGNYFGASRGRAGEMFSNAIDRLYEKCVALVEKTNNWAQSLSPGAHTPAMKDDEKTEMKIADIFAKMDAGSKSGLTQSFKNALAQARSLVQQYCGQYGLAPSYVGLAGATDGIMKQFEQFDKILGTET